MKTFKLIVVNLFIIAILLILIEVICLLLTDEKERNASVLIDSDAIRINQSINEGTLDPLLGYTFNNNSQKRYKGKVKFDTAILTDSIACEDTLVILITGGSTSDIITELGTWPKYLHEALIKNNICAQIKVAGVSGYHSGQELLKLIKYHSIYRPDIHISYSGVNEPTEYRYTTTYEEDILQRKLEPKSYILPYTTHYLRKKIGLRLNSVKLRLDVPKIESHKFWEQNMKLMHHIATGNQSIFIGLLQPSLGVGPHQNQDNEVFQKGIFNGSYDELMHDVNEYKEFYPKALKICNEHDYLFDFTNIFKDELETPFFDDCHITEEYQIKLGYEVFRLLKKEGLIHNSFIKNKE